MEIVNGWLKVLQQWVTYISYCVEQPVQTPICEPFWTWAMIGLFAIGVLAAIVIVWKIISYKFKLAAALRAQEERERIDHDAIEAGRWDGDKAYSAELGGEEVERRIREAVNQRHLAKSTEQDKLNIV